MDYQGVFTMENNKNNLLLSDTDALQLMRERTGKEYALRTFKAYILSQKLPKPVLKHRGVLFFDREEFIVAIDMKLKKRQDITATA